MVGQTHQKWGELLIVGALALLVFSFTMKTLVSAQEMEDHYPSILDWNSDGTKLAIGYVSGEIEIRDFTTSQTTIEDYGEQIMNLDWHPSNPDVLAVADVYGNFRILDISTNSLLLDVQIGDLIYEVAWHPQADTIAISTHNYEYEPGQQFEEAVVVIDAVNGTETYLGAVSQLDISQIAWSPDGNRLAMGGAGGLITIRDISGSSPSLALQGHTDDVRDLSWGLNGDQIVSSGDNTLRFWDTDDGTNIAVLTFELGGGPLALSSTGLIAVTVGAEDIHIIDAITRETLYILEDLRYVRTLAWSPDGEQLAYAGPDDEGVSRTAIVQIDDLLSITPTATPEQSLTPSPATP